MPAGADGGHVSLIGDGDAMGAVAGDGCAPRGLDARGLLERRGHMARASCVRAAFAAARGGFRELLLPHACGRGRSSSISPSSSSSESSSLSSRSQVIHA